MSGNIGNSYTSADDGSQRYREMVEQIRRNNTILSTCDTLYESRLGASVNNMQQPSISNGTLTTQQFYTSDSTSTTNQFIPSRAASTNSQASTNTGLFHLPKTTKQYSGIIKYKTRMEYAQRDFFNIQDNSNMKLIMRIFENSLSLLNSLPPMDPVDFIDLLAKMVKEKFYIRQIPQMISSAGSTSSLQFNNFYDNHIQLPFSSRPGSTATSQTSVHNNENVVVQLPKSSTSTQTMEPVVVLNKTNATSMESGFSGSQLRSRLRNQSQVLPSPNMNINLFDDSQIASIRDQLAVEEATQQRSRRKPKASTAARPTKVDASIVAQQKVVVNPKDISQLPGVKAVTRTGRPIKSPASFWAVDKDVTIKQQPKQNGTSRTTKVDLNDTLTLRSKVIERKTPPNRNRIDSANSTPLSPITENKLLLKNSNKSQIKKSQVQENKENSEVQKKRTTKSTNKNKTNVSEDSSKEKSKMKVGRSKKKTQPVNKHDVSLMTSWSSGSPWNGWIHNHSSSLPKNS
uniref:Uncharacterized protein n=1 Tax=Homalodisca liturata TaxID=320908 RepID=A0A1B6ICB1_9HEMI